MFDLHVHTCYSADGKEKPERIARYLKKMGFRGMAIVDHHTVKGALRAKREIKNFLIIPGEEINTERGHILAFGIEEEIKSRKSMEVVEEIHDKGGIAILAHPFRFSRPRIKTDGMEAMNGRNFPVQNKRSMEYVKKKGLPFTAGSDGHNLWEMGSTYTIMNAESVDEVIDEIMEKRVSIEGNMSFLHPLKCQFYSLVSFMERGFRRIK